MYLCTYMRRKIELLAPARDLECGKEAILHGADAVYIGGPLFGARAAASNSVEDIAALCAFAHMYGAKVYVTLNTILYDAELEAAERMVWLLYEHGVDALIVQDMALLRLNLPPIALHASTQTDNRTVEKVRWLEDMGFSQIVLARELGVREIAAIYDAVHVPLEAFVHGALCVSYSGQCYASQYCFGRSANRGQCAQFCRLPFDLLDSKGRVLAKDKHLLSLKDMNRSAFLEEMLDAGVSSFKIEGRLKDIAYVKNVTAYYRQKLDEILSRRPNDYVRSSFGQTDLNFTPQLEKSFNRGFTDYFLHGRTPDLCSFETPKAKGEFIGEVSLVGNRSFSVRYVREDDASLRLHAGDGLCFIGPDGKLQGFRVNKVDGMDIYPASMPVLSLRTLLYRNQDAYYEKMLSRPTAVRRLLLQIVFAETEEGYSLWLCDETGVEVLLNFPMQKIVAQSPQRDNMIQILSKLGDTPFKVAAVTVELNEERFIPSSVLTKWRRKVVDALMEKKTAEYKQEVRKLPKMNGDKVSDHITYLGNVANALSRDLYEQQGAMQIDPAFELCQPDKAVIMVCRHCLRFALGRCSKRLHGCFQDKKDCNEPWRLRMADGRVFTLEFDCVRCQMKIYAP